MNVECHQVYKQLDFHQGSNMAYLSEKVRDFCNLCILEHNLQQFWTQSPKMNKTELDRRKKHEINI